MDDGGFRERENGDFGPLFLFTLKIKTMYGKPLDPKKTTFAIGNDGGQIYVTLMDQEDDDNDDVREVDHPDWDILFGNAMENVFEPWDQAFIDNELKASGRSDKLKELTTVDEVRNYLLSIGMTEDQTAMEDMDD